MSITMMSEFRIRSVTYSKYSLTIDLKDFRNKVRITRT